MVKIYLEDENKTKEIGYKLGNLLVPGSVICLIGDLGAGKTTMTQSLAKALEVDDYITSPTFTIVNEYEGKMPLYHFDVYRIGSSDEMYDIGYEEYVNGEGVCIIEWANLIEDILPDEYLHIELKYKDMSREMILNPVGEKYEKIVEELDKIMKVLGIDTSSLATSVAVIEDNKLICEYTINTKKTHSQKLMPMIENMLNISDLNINEIDLIAVCEGPGSFTGLRIAMANS